MRIPFQTLRWVLPLVWAALTVGASLAHRYAWGPFDPGVERSALLETVCIRVSNAAQVINGPVWIASWLLVPHRAGLASALVLHGVGFAGWIGCIWLALVARRHLKTRSRQAPAEAIPTGAAVLSRRAFLADSMLVTGVGCAGAGGVYSSCVEPWSLRVRRYSIPIAGMAPGLDGLRLVQLSDTHLGPRIPASFIKEAVELARSLAPDLYLLTGDYVHNGVEYIEPAAALFRPLLEPRAGLIGTLGVLGNHDHYADAARMTAALTAVGVRMLDNARVFLDAKERRLSPILAHDDSLCIGGVGDLLEGTVEINAALRDATPDIPRVLLSHNPDVAESRELAPGKGNRVDLMISGHTHGGQVRLPLIGAPAVPSNYGSKYAHGLVQGPACPVVVSAGVGMSILPVRFGVAPEVVEITLVSA